MCWSSKIIRVFAGGCLKRNKSDISLHHSIYSMWPLHATNEKQEAMFKMLAVAMLLHDIWMKEIWHLILKQLLWSEHPLDLMCTYMHKNRIKRCRQSNEEESVCLTLRNIQTIKKNKLWSLYSWGAAAAAAKCDSEGKSGPTQRPGQDKEQISLLSFSGHEGYAMKNLHSSSHSNRAERTSLYQVLLFSRLMGQNDDVSKKVWYSHLVFLCLIWNFLI